MRRRGKVKASSRIDERTTRQYVLPEQGVDLDFIMKLVRVAGAFAVCRLPPKSPPPVWLFESSSFYSLTKTEDELSIVCLQSLIPPTVEPCEKDWSCLKVQGPLDFGLTGIIASLASPLANVGVSIFAVATYDTDYLLVKTKQLESAIDTLKKEGHSVG